MRVCAGEEGQKPEDRARVSIMWRLDAADAIRLIGNDLFKKGELDQIKVVEYFIHVRP